MSLVRVLWPRGTSLAPRGPRRCCVLVACGVLGLSSLAADAEDLVLQAPESCPALDRALQTDSPLANFIAHGLDTVSAALIGVDQPRACRIIRERSAYASSVIGLATYCDNEQVLVRGRPNNVLYRRIGDAVRTIGNALDDLARQHHC